MIEMPTPFHVGRPHEEAEVLRVKADILLELRDELHSDGLSNMQPYEIAAIEKGRIDEVSLEDLLKWRLKSKPGIRMVLEGEHAPPRKVYVLVKEEVVPAELTTILGGYTTREAAEKAQSDAEDADYSDARNMFTVQECEVLR